MGHVGNMNEKIILLKELSSQSATDGSFTNSWTEVATVWAEKINIKAREDVIKDKMTLETSIDFKIRYRNDIKPNYRVNYRNEVYRIISIKEIERKFYMELEIAILS